MKTLEESISAITKEYEEKVSNEKMLFEIVGKSGFNREDIIIYSTKTIGFFWRGDGATKEQIKKIIELFPINGKNHEVTFANKDKNFVTDSPLWLTWDNNDFHFPKKLKIRYLSGDVEIQVTIKPDHFTEHFYYSQRKGRHLGFGRYETFNDLNIAYFYTQKYSGGSNVLYFLEGAESHKEWINFILTGEFKYENEM